MEKFIFTDDSALRLFIMPYTVGIEAYRAVCHKVPKGTIVRLFNFSYENGKVIFSWNCKNGKYGNGELVNLKVFLSY